MAKQSQHVKERPTNTICIATYTEANDALAGVDKADGRIVNKAHIGQLLGLLNQPLVHQLA